MFRRVVFSLVCSGLIMVSCKKKEASIIMTVNGPVNISQMGATLVHEHILVDFIGADSIDEKRWDKENVKKVVLPYLYRIKALGCQTFIECTPAYLGRDPLLLKSLSSSSGLNIITNTGIYGAGNNKFVPGYAFVETADQLASRWTNEFENGIGETGVRPGFIKIGVGTESLSELHRKLVTAAARTHLKTGLTIASHTGPAKPAFEEIEILKKEGVSPDAFIWVHAQNETDLSTHIRAAGMGAWISLDGIDENNLDRYIIMIGNMKQNGMLGKVLLSHDAGWYHPGEENGGPFRGYSTLFEELVPRLKKAEFSEKEINQLLVLNPAEAFRVRIRKLK
jgi:phosphotriesterase-related protein